jgi:hypothetical protein
MFATRTSILYAQLNPPFGVPQLAPEVVKVDPERAEKQREISLTQLESPQAGHLTISSVFKTSVSKRCPQVPH